MALFASWSLNNEPLQVVHTVKFPRTIPLAQNVNVPGGYVGALHTFTFFALAVSHPIYALLGLAEHAPFLTAHQSQAADIYLLIWCLSIVMPALIWSVIWLAGRWSARLGTVLNILVLYVLLQ